MCPYWSESKKLCVIYNQSSPSDNCIETWCRERKDCYTNCPNYNEAKRVHGGRVPDPEWYMEKANWSYM